MSRALAINPDLAADPAYAGVDASVDEGEGEGEGEDVDARAGECLAPLHSQ
jgi:hypothetical protein